MNIKMNYTKQGEESANCGPCSLKMIADYYGIKKRDGSPYSVQSLNRLLNVTSEWGCEKSDMNRVLRRLGLSREKVKITKLNEKLARKKPILTLLIDEDGIGHYAVIKGIKRDKVIFHDSYWGPNFKRDLKNLKKQIVFFNDWVWAVSPKDSSAY